MSLALYELGGLRFWTEDEISLREAFQARAIEIVKRTLLDLNPAWSFARMEGPCLAPRNTINAAYTEADLFSTNHLALGDRLYLRPETTPSSYAYARHLNRRMPFCVYQAGKSFRRETNDGASAAKLRFNEFWQLEFQCIYHVDTKADYRTSLIGPIDMEIRRFTMRQTRVVPSDRVPGYAESTVDIEAEHGDTWREIASCSIRTDYAPMTRVCEIAIGLDRVASLSADQS